MTLVVTKTKMNVPSSCHLCNKISKLIKCNKDGFIEWLCKKCINKIRKEVMD